LHKEECDLISLIKEVINETKYLLKDKEISLKFETKLSCAITNVDIIEIKRVINNLIGNAYDYAPVGSEIILSLVKIAKEFYISVSDSGCGINLKNPNDIFDCNLTLAKENKRIGFGLGLFISKNIVENHNGRIFVESEVDKGTTITFTLPV
jgi:two-component system CheB/CheR fusion protein